MSSGASQAPSGASGRIVRHRAIDRWLHWLIALAVLVLLGTAFLPILGVEFAWVAIHWVTGFALIALVLSHIVRSLLFRRIRKVWIGLGDIRDAVCVLRRTFRLSDQRPPLPGKYSFSQKLIHFGFAAVVLSACVTGGLMMVKIDTPWWDRNPFWLSDPVWGVVYIVHGLAALLMITMVICHIYFALRPEKRQFLRAMLMGWITRDEFRQSHDPNRWRVDR